MTFFKEIPIGNLALRFYPSDNGWMCGITTEMMKALEAPQRTWVGLTDEDTQAAWDAMKDYDDFDTYTKVIEAKLKEKNT